jgi:ATP-dependent protease HslVU (ClpYQ) peptidase subunit
MTCIVGLKANNKVYLAGERGASNEDSIMHLTKPKIHKFGPYVVGFAGTMEGQRLAHSFDPPRPHEDQDLDQFMHTTFLRYLRDFYDEWWVDFSKDGELSMLIGIKDKLYEHHASDMSLNEYSIGYSSIGTGSPFAMGFLYAAQSFDNPEKIVEGAVKSAIKFSPTCSGTIDILST